MAENGTTPARPSANDVPARRKRAPTGRLRAWRRGSTLNENEPGCVRVFVAGLDCEIAVRGPQARVEAIVDQLLRELPE